MRDLEINTRKDPEDKQAIFVSSLKIVSQIMRIKLLSITFLLLFSHLLVYDCLCIADITKTVKLETKLTHQDPVTCYV